MTGIGGVVMKYLIRVVYLEAGGLVGHRVHRVIADGGDG